MDRVDRYLQKRWLPVLLTALKENSKEKLAARMEQWDGSMEPESHEAALMVLFLVNLRKTMLQDELGEKLLRRLSDEDFEQIFNGGPESYFDNQQTKDHLETREEIISTALKEALKQWQDRSWGEIHTLTMSHPFAKVPLLSNFFNLKMGPIPWGGSSGTLNASFFMEDKNIRASLNPLLAPAGVL